MGAPHNPKRYGETWPQHRIDACLHELTLIRSMVIISGGWAWHFMSPKGHKELKHAHDHKDIDIFIPPEFVGAVIGTLKSLGFRKIGTRFDRLPSDDDFRRYERTVVTAEGDVRVTMDTFVRKDVPFRDLDGWRVVEPAYLLTLYSDIHSSDKCFAVTAAKKLLDRGIDPVGRPELVQIPKEEKRCDGR